MKLPRRHTKTFIRREWRAGRHLRKSLRAPKQTKHGKKAKSLRPLKVASALELNASNGASRALWFEHVAARVCRKVGATAPKLQATTPVFLVTIVDRTDLIKDDGNTDFAITTRVIRQIKNKQGWMLRGLNFIGMIDVSLIVSARTVLGVPRAMAVHGHYLVWGISLEEIDSVCSGINLTTRPVLPYASAADVRPVRDLLQVIWYVHKLPHKQYQLWRRTKGKSLKQYKRNINGVNAVRLYEAMENLSLPQLAIAGGDGVRLRNRVFDDVGWHRPDG